MKTKLLLFNILTLLALAVVILRGQGAGPLNPPAAPADGVYLTLEEVYNAARDPRTPIESLPLTISESGSYYLPGNLQFSQATGDAITINASHVTLDLMGHTLGSDAGVIGTAIRVNAGYVTVQNGHIHGTTVLRVNTAGEAMEFVSTGGFQNAIAVSGEWYDNPGLTCRNLTVRGCRGDGIQGNDSSRFESCQAYSNGGSGLIGLNACGAFHCAARGNNIDGISMGVGVISSCLAHENGGTGLLTSSFGTVHGSSAVDNLSWGIKAGAASFCSAIGSSPANLSAQVSTGNLAP